MKRKSLMRHASVFCGSALALLFQGCISFATGPERSFTESGTKYQLSVKSVSRVNAKIERLQYSSGTPCYSLKLIADGNFVSHEGHSSMIGTPCMSFGLWPACADNEDKKGDVFICSIIFSCGLAGMPTLASLIFEPFREYRERQKVGYDLADYGLIGFNKYYRDVRKDESRGFQTVATTNITSYELFGYTVSIDGTRYEDKDYGSGCSGVVYFNSSRPSGSRISIRIEGVPSARSDGNEGFSGMEGMVITATLP